MAFMSQDRKKQLAEGVKKALAGTGIKYTISVHHHSSINLNIKSGPIDFLTNAFEVAALNPRYSGNHAIEKQKSINVNVYWYKEHFTGKALEVLEKAITALNVGNHDRSDIQSDYFDVGWYVNVNIGQWDKPYEVTK
jgi:hypothetical protein